MPRFEQNAGIKFAVVAAALIAFMWIVAPPKMPSWGREAMSWWRQAYKTAGSPHEATPPPSTRPTQYAAPHVAQQARDSSRLAMAGLIVVASESGDRGIFYDVGLSGEEDPDALGLIRTAALRDTTTLIDALGSRRHTLRLVAVPDSTIHVNDIGCLDPIEMGVRPASGERRKMDWTVGLHPGVVTQIHPEPRRGADSRADTAEARRLAKLIPEDSVRLAEGLPPANELLAGIPLVVERTEHIVDGDVDLFVAQATREMHRTMPGYGSGNDTLSVAEMVFMVAERKRDGGGATPFTIAWSVREARESNELAHRYLMQAIRAGRPERLMLLVGWWAEGSEGGQIIARAGPVKWTTVGSWASVCD